MSMNMNGIWIVQCVKTPRSELKLCNHLQPTFVLSISIMIEEFLYREGHKILKFINNLKMMIS